MISPVTLWLSLRVEVRRHASCRPAAVLDDADAVVSDDDTVDLATMVQAESRSVSGSD